MNSQVILRRLITNWSDYANTYKNIMSEFVETSFCARVDPKGDLSLVGDGKVR